MRSGDNASGRHRSGETAGVTWHTHYALLMLALIYVFNYIDRLVISILIEPIKLEFGVSDTAIGLLSGVAFALFYTVFGFPFGRLADRIGPKPVIALACVAWSVMTMTCGLATSFAILLLCRIGVAVGEAGGTAPSVAMVSALYPPQRRSLALSVFLMGPSLGAVIGLGVGGWVAETWGWRTAFIAIGAPGVLLGLVFALTVRAPASTTTVKGQARGADENWRTTLRSLFATPAFPWIVATGGIAATTGYALGTWNPSFLIRSHGLTMQHAGLLIGVGGGLVSTVGTLVCGAVTDRMVRRDPGWQIGVPLLATALSIPFGVAYFLWPTGIAFQLGTLPVPQAFLLYLGFGFFGTWWSVPCFGAISHLFPAQRLAQATAIFVMAMTLLGVGFGPLIVGALSDAFSARLGTEALRYALAASVGLLGLAVACLGIALPRYRNRLGTAQAAVPEAVTNPA